MPRCPCAKKIGGRRQKHKRPRRPGRAPNARERCLTDPSRSGHSGTHAPVPSRGDACERLVSAADRRRGWRRGAPDQVAEGGLPARRGGRPAAGGDVWLRSLQLRADEHGRLPRRRPARRGGSGGAGVGRRILVGPLHAHRAWAGPGPRADRAPRGRKASCSRGAPPHQARDRRDGLRGAALGHLRALPAVRWPTRRSRTRSRWPPSTSARRSRCTSSAPMAPGRCRARRSTAALPTRWTRGRRASARRWAPWCRLKAQAAQPARAAERA